MSEDKKSPTKAELIKQIKQNAVVLIKGHAIVSDRDNWILHFPSENGEVSVTKVHYLSSLPSALRDLYNNLLKIEGEGKRMRTIDQVCKFMGEVAGELTKNAESITAKLGKDKDYVLVRKKK